MRGVALGAWSGGRLAGCCCCCFGGGDGDGDGDGDGGLEQSVKSKFISDSMLDCFAIAAGRCDVAAVTATHDDDDTVAADSVEAEATRVEHSSAGCESGELAVLGAVTIAAATTVALLARRSRAFCTERRVASLRCCMTLLTSARLASSAADGSQQLTADDCGVATKDDGGAEGGSVKVEQKSDCCWWRSTGGS